MTNREIDRLIAENVFGAEVRVCRIGADPDPGPMIFEPGGAYGFLTARDLPHYSARISSAWEVVEKMRDRGFIVDIHSASRRMFSSVMHLGREDEGWREWDRSAPRAICIAALKALGVEAE